ncbi:SAP domain-containing protein [Planococcus sp. N028]|uniref:SAP domain-containing protein n=1 Tax=Planococcus shixiaomingii TaxID=3058393 RepID=A0ABT8N302_9BACL|nr:SAP domain-containing protein [Planococcus sp. N028]MDN7242266.1 SAP domain-containing protein [Planococcus sp. N028]
MTKFSPPAINNKNSKYKVEDILVLHELNKRPTFVNAPLETFSGHTHSIDSFKTRNIFLDFLKVVSNLQENELIRENLPREILKHLTVVEMKVILKAVYKPVNGTRDVLINRIETHATDEDISNHTDKSCFVLTELGLEVLGKYKNVLWIHKNKEDIFRYPLFYESKFDEYYFIDHWELNPSNTIIDYYESKNSGIVARIYQIENNREKSFLYGLRKLTEEINLQLEKCKEGGWFNTSAGLGEFLSLYASPVLGEPLSSKTIFKALNISDDNFEDILKYIYDFAIKDPSLVTFNNFNEIIIALLTNPGDELYRELLGNLYQSIRGKFGHEHYQEDINNYHQKGFDDEEKEEKEEEENLMDILDLFIDDENRKLEMVFELIDILDLEVIKEMKVKIDNRLTN